MRELQQSNEELQSAKEEAESANRAKDRFLAMLSHELRTPLSPVLLMASMLQRRPDLPTDTREALGTICRNVELESRLIDDLLDMSRILSGKLHMQVRPASLHAIVRHAISICGEPAASKNIRIVDQLSAPSDAIEGDPARLQQVIWNLLHNAIKFSPEGGTIHVASDGAEGSDIQVSVTDGGIGIPSDAIGRIFDAFEQGANRTAYKFGGMGLGLAIAKSIVEAHRGAIVARSEGVGHGATFTVRLPLIPEQAPAASGPEENGADGAGAPVRPARVLLVEDHVDTARALRIILTSEGFDLAVAHTAASALQIAAAAPFDIIVSDVGLPDASGYDLMRRVRAVQPIPGIALTGYGTERDLLEGRAAGFSEHLVKPVNPTLLTQAIRRVVDSHR